MRALIFTAPVFLIIIAFWISNSGYFERRSLKKDTRRYLHLNPDHSVNEPISWQCICSHNDNMHSRWNGCTVKFCTCVLSPREVRARY